MHKESFGMRGFNLDHLKTFIDVAELGSFTAAAERAGLTQPAVSQQIKQLERYLGVRLVERVGKRATPTNAGAELLVHARRIDEALVAARESMAPHAAGIVGRVRIGTSGTACIYLLPPILKDLKRRFPTLEVVVSTANAADIARDVEENAIDVGLVTLPVAGRMLDVTPLIDDAFVAVAPADEVDFPDPVTPADLSDRPFLHHDPGSQTGRIIDDWFARGGVAMKPAMELSSTEAMKEMVGAGLGRAVISRIAISRTAGQTPLTVRPLAPHLSRTFGLVLRRDKPLNRGLREMVNALKAAANVEVD
jgi:DNA-binding transcriptional LysR family regulator